jgi:tRNA(Leu) C34 or U34 (ribose-2'-O)-methylase TrmL
MVERKFDPKWLEGLVFHYADKKMVEKNGRKTLQAIAMQRPLKEEDVMSWKDYEDRVVIATNDGKKYTVKKKGAGNADPKEPKK